MTKPINPRSKAYRSVAQLAGCHAVCLIGWKEPGALRVGDNQGIWPVRVTTAAKESSAADRANAETPHIDVVVLEYVLVPTETHAKRLKVALDEVLLGEQEGQDNRGFKKPAWKNVIGIFEVDDDEQRHMWWQIILQEAERLLAGGASYFPIYESADEVHKIISNKVLKQRG